MIVYRAVDRPSVSLSTADWGAGRVGTGECPWGLVSTVCLQGSLEPPHAHAVATTAAAIVAVRMELDVGNHIGSPPAPKANRRGRRYGAGIGIAQTASADLTHRSRRP